MVVVAALLAVLEPAEVSVDSETRMSVDSMHCILLAVEQQQDASEAVVLASHS